MLQLLHTDTGSSEHLVLMYCLWEIEGERERKRGRGKEGEGDEEEKGGEGRREGVKNRSRGDLSVTRIFLVHIQSSAYGCTDPPMLYNECSHHQPSCMCMVSHYHTTTLSHTRDSTSHPLCLLLEC